MALNAKTATEFAMRNDEEKEKRQPAAAQRILCSFELNKHVVDDCVRCAVHLSFVHSMNFFPFVRHFVWQCERFRSKIPGRFEKFYLFISLSRCVFHTEHRG